MRVENNGWRSVKLLNKDNEEKYKKAWLCRILHIKKNKISSS